ncbi:acid phosphatase [Scheffersomyces amazonensis]|uniref:acid phosphatase n=1 Tax=Scheffersomyces amazonensis TaxID=1078765 RepID=UPI00315DDA7E
MVALNRLLTSGLIFGYPNHFTEVASPDLAAKEQYNIVRYLAAAGPYVQNPGYGISTDIPKSCTIEQVHYLSRHGERFPGLWEGKTHEAILEKILKTPGKLQGDLEFLNNYKYYVTSEDLYELETTPENSNGPYTGYGTAIRAGKSFAEKYSSLLNKDEPLPVFIAASQRVYDTAINFVKAFLGNDYSSNSVKQVIISEDSKYGLNSLVPRWGCPAFNSDAHKEKVLTTFPKDYLEDIVFRWKSSNPELDLNSDDVYHIFEICAYELNSRGYSPFCNLFSKDEFVSYGYNRDLEFYYSSGPGGQNAINAGATQLKATMKLLEDNNNENKIWLSFTHDTDIELFSSALGLFDTIEPMPMDKIRLTDTYHHVNIVPMGARIITEKLKKEDNYFIRFIVNDAVIPVPGCSSGPGFSCPFDQFKQYIQGRIGHLNIPKDCNTAPNVPQELTFYWDYKEVTYDAPAIRINPK